MRSSASSGKKASVSGLYKGVTSPMLGVALMNASVFTSYKYTMNLLLPGSDAEPNLWQITAAGSASGVFTSLITTPIERIKILQQSLPRSSSSPNQLAQGLTPSAGAAPPSSLSATSRSRPPPHPPSTWTLLRTLSLPSLYRGWSATVLRDVGYGPYFLVYEYVVRGGTLGLFPSVLGSGGGASGRHYKKDLKEEIDGEVFGIGEGVGEDGQKQEGASTARVLVAGGLAGIVGWGCTFPVDVVKTKIQSVPPAPPPSLHLRGSASTPASSPSSPPAPKATPSATATPTPYTSIRATIAATLHESGWRGFVAGLGPTLVRSVPVNMVTFAVFELVVATFR
ncbi:hypothetical protein JCM8202v2_002666 [Rhodotorula sphaerocarpa]